MPQTQAEFFQQHAVDGVLTPEQIGQMINLPEGDTVITTESGTPAPAPAPADPPAPAPAPAPSPAPAPAPAADPDPANTVIAAKDGIHTIEYQKLVDAREGERVAKAQAEAALAEAERLRQELAQKTAQAPAAPAPAPAPAPAADVADFGDFSDAALAKGITEAVDRRVAAATQEIEAKFAEKLTAVEKQAQLEATQKHFQSIYEKHADMDTLLESRELEGWITAKPSYEQAAIRTVLEQGTAAQVIELFDSFKASAGKTPPPAPSPSPAPAPAADAAAQAAAAAAKAVEDAKAKPPSSLSEIPGSTSVVDEAAAMLEMSPLALLNRFKDRSPEEIHRALSKVI